MPSFQPIRDVPMAGVSQWEADILNQLKENVELLTGMRINGIQAITSDKITTTQTNNVTMTRISAQGAGASYSGSPNFALLADYQLLCQDVQSLAGNVVNLQQQVNSLIAQLTS